MIIYSDEQYKAQDVIDQYGFDPRVNDLSRAKDWDEFVRKMEQVGKSKTTGTSTTTVSASAASSVLQTCSRI